jgi:predicted branched-subunit amino acid permease
MPDPSTITAASRAGPARGPLFTRAGVWRGFVAAQPLTIGVFVYGVTVGVLAGERGLSMLEAMLMSATVYSGSAQVAALGGFAAGAGVLASMLTVVLLNSRYLLYGAALRPWLGGAPAARAYGTLYLLGDASWVMSMKAHADGEDDAGFVLGTGIAGFLPWMAGTASGLLAGGWAGDPRRLGLDFLLVAFCAAMAIGLFRRGDALLPATTAIGVSLVVDRLAPSGWTVVAAGLAGGLVAALRAPSGR